MVQVVKLEPHPSVVKEVVCRNCGATLSYVPADVQRETFYDYHGDGETMGFIKCPPCGNKVYIKKFRG
jgi:ribosomal protein S27E